MDSPVRQKGRQLTPRERRILRLLIDGHDSKTTARAMGISVNTVSFHLKNVYLKLQVHSKTAAAVKALNAGLVGPVECEECRKARARAAHGLPSDMARYSQARANVHSRSTVARDTPVTLAISSIVSPPKNLSSTT